MHDNLLYAVISTIEEVRKFKCENINQELFQEFESLDLNLESKRLFQHRWFSENIEVGPTIYSSENILKSEKENLHLKNGIIEIGYCPNGDEIFFRDKDSAILYWSHDEAEDWQNDENSLFVVYRRVEYFLLNICNRNFIPWDSYSGQEYYELYDGK